MKKTIVIYHANCNDGFGAALAAWMKFGPSKDVTFIAGRYGDPAPDVAGANVYLLDFSYKRDVIARMLDEAHTLTVIDHHKTAAEDLAPLGIVIDQTQSGAVLAWKHFFPGTPVPPLLLYVQDRDLWRWELPQSREVSAALSVLPQDFRVWSSYLFEVTDLAREGYLRGYAHAALRIYGPSWCKPRAKPEVK